MIGNPLLLGGGDYEISRSVRLRSSANAYFSRTFAASSGTTDTISFWVKRGQLGAAQSVLDTSNGVTTSFGIFFNASDSLEFYDYSSVYRLRLVTTQVFRDPSAWYHIVCHINTTNATAANRAKVYVNGSEVTAFSTATYPAQNTSLNIGGTQAWGIGVIGNIGGQNLDGYLTEFNLIDGQALTPSSFGESNSITGVWQPKKYTGTYGTNGFYLNFSDNSNNTAATIGKDYSGNGNNWTPNNISVTAGVTYDSMLDVPTLWADGGNGRGNYPVINPLDYAATNSTVSNGNLTWTTNTSGSNNYQRASMKFPTSGKWYAEFTATQVNIGSGLGYALVSVEGSNSFLWWVYSSPFYQIQGTSGSYSTIPTISSGDIIMFAVDMDLGKAWYGQNGTWLLSGNPANGTAMSNPATFTAGSSNIGIALDGRTGSNTNIINANFGQRPFAYTPPTGFRALNTQNLPEPTIKKGNAYFDAYLNTGNGTSRTDVIAFQPDLVWTKSRSATGFNIVQDSVRGAGNRLITDGTFAEDYNATYGSFTSTGFAFGSNLNVNTNGVSYVDWFWKEGATQGFDIVTYTGNGTNPGRTVAHNLGVAPAMIITKSRSGTGEWPSYHKSLPISNTLYLNATYASSTYLNRFSAVSSTDFTTGTNGSELNTNGVTYVAYLFAEVAGFSRFGSYTGNGSTDGPFVFCGFRPRWVMMKRTDTGGFSWIIQDTARDVDNPNDLPLYPDLSNAEAASNFIDILSNGFKLKNLGGGWNASGGTYIFTAFAENPFKNALAR